MNAIRHCLAWFFAGFALAIPGRAQTVGEVVQTDGEVCGWVGDVERRCGDEAYELRERSSIDRGMTVRTEEGGPLACVMTIDEQATDGGGVVIMRPQTLIRISGEVLADFEVEMEQLDGVIRIVLPPKRDRELRVRAGTAFIVLHGTYVEVRLDKVTGEATVGVLEGWASVTGLVLPGVPLPPVLPETPPAGAPSSRVFAGEKVDVAADGTVSVPYPFSPNAPATDPAVIVEDESLPAEPGTQGPGPVLLPLQVCDLPRGVCNP